MTPRGFQIRVLVWRRRRKGPSKKTRITASRLRGSQTTWLSYWMCCLAANVPPGKLAQFLEDCRGIGLCRSHRCPNLLRRRPNHGLCGVCSVCGATSFSLAVVAAFPNALQRFRQRRSGPKALPGKPVSHAPHSNCLRPIRYVYRKNRREYYHV